MGRVNHWKLFLLPRVVLLTWQLCPSACSLVTYLQNALPGGFVIFTLKLLSVWKCPFGPSPWYLRLWSPCHFGFEYSCSSWKPKGTSISNWMNKMLVLVYCIHWGLQAYDGEAHLLMYLLARLYTESLECLLHLGGLSHTELLALQESWRFFWL